jgi:hypothetical protein
MIVARDDEKRAASVSLQAANNSASAISVW